MEESKPIVSVTDLSIAFGGEGKPAVSGLSFSIAAGRTLAVVGESGSGKSVTSLALMRLLPKTAAVTGSMLLDGKDLAPLSPKDWQALRGSVASMVFQEPMSALNPIMKVGKQLTEAILAHQKKDKAIAHQEAIEWLAKVQLPQPDALFHRYPHQLSGGQKQRVMIAMAMCGYPKLLIADEPTTALDATVQAEVLQLMRYLQEQYGTAMLFITHDLGVAAAMADDILVMRQGEMIEFGNAQDVLSNPQQAYTKAMLACRPNAGQKGFRLPAVDDFLRSNGNPVPLIPTPAVAHNNAEKVIAATTVSIWFPDSGREGGNFKAVDGVSFNLHKGEVLGLVGESGCGKSTLSRALMGLLPLHDGQLLIDGKDMSNAGTGEWRQARRHIQMIFQDPYASLNPRLTVGDAIAEPMIVHGLASAKEARQRATQLLEKVQLPASAYSRYPHQFSGGQRQRIGIARALSLNPKILICDESVSALDVSVQAQILNLLKDLQAAMGLSYLFISHDLSVVHYISDWVMVMQAGKIIEEGAAGVVLSHPQQEYTKRLIAAVKAV